MLPDTELLLIVLSLLVAFIVGARAVLAWQALSTVSANLEGRVILIEDMALSVPRRATALRARLAAVNAGVEQALWALARVDESTEAAAHRLGEVRGALDRVRGADMAGARRAVRRLRSAVQLINQAIRLRRTVLG